MNLFGSLRSKVFAPIRSWNWEIPALVAIVALTVWRLSSVMPSFLADEFLYKQQAINAGPYDDAVVANTGNYLYFWLFTSVEACGPSFYSCNKILNGLIWLLAGLLLFKVGARIVSRHAAFLLAATVLASPLASYVTVFMPEITYYALGTLVIIFTWFYLESPSTAKALVLGAALGSLWLVKPHALFLLAGVVILSFGLFFRGFRSVFKARHFAAITSTTVLVRLVAGFIFAGPRSLSLFADYGDAGASGLAAIPSLLQTLWSILPAQLVGHALVITIGLGPLVVIGLAVYGRGHTLDQTNRRLLVVLGITHFVLLTATILFAALVTQLGDDHTYRVLARYYEWIYVGYALVLFRLFSSPVRERRTVFFVLAIATAAIVSVSGFQQYRGYNLKISDSLFGTAYLLNAPSFFIWLAVPALIALTAFWMKSTALTLVLVTTFSFGLGLASNQQFINFRPGQNTGDAAGLFANDFIGKNVEGEKVLVVANSKFTAASAAFWIETESIDFLEVYRFSSVTEDVFESGQYNWLLSVGEISLHNVPREVAVRGVGFELAKLGSSREMYFSRTSPNSPFRRGDALGVPTAPWGVWLVDNEPIELVANGLQQASELVIRYKLPEQSSGAEIAVEVNGVSYEFTIPPLPLSSTLSVDLGKTVRIQDVALRIQANREWNDSTSFFIPPDGLGLVSIELVG